MKRVIIIGASSGIGRMLTEHYASCGYKVAIAARREENLREIAGLFPDNIIYRTMDVTMASARDGFTAMVKSLGGADLVIYCSGYGKNSYNLSTDVEFATVGVNIQGFLNIIVPAFNYFIGRKEVASKYRPQIVTISSIASFRGLGASPAYSATKRFQTIYFESLAQLATIKGVKIDFTAITPGFIATDFINKKYPCTMQLPYAVKRIIRAIETRKKNAVIDWRWAFAAFFMKLIPTYIWRKIPLG